MEDNKKKPIMIGVIVVCIVVAGLMTFARLGGEGVGIDTIPDDKMTWVKCANPSCGAEYQMSEKKYIKAMQERFDLNPSERIQGLTCNKCGKNSLFQAYKCANPSCGHVFIRGIADPEIPDRCPKCKQSETEQIRKKRLSGQQ
jgi:hypothetical protein